MTMWGIFSWTGRRLFDGKTFDSFEDGWEFIYRETANDPEVNDEHFFDEFYVERVA